MVVCKYFLQGNCRYGNYCKFDHTQNQYQSGSRYNIVNSSSNQQYSQYNNQNVDVNKYKYVASNQQTAFQQQQQSSKPAALMSNLFTNLVSKSTTNQSDSAKAEQEFLQIATEDFKTFLSNPMWKLSCYSYNQSTPCLPILQDISPEEVRFELYEANKKNKFSFAFNQFQNKYNQTIETIKSLAHPNEQAKNYLIQYFNESKQLVKMQQNQQKQELNNVNPFELIVKQRIQGNQDTFGQQQQQMPVANFLQMQQTNQIQTSGSFVFSTQNKQQENPFSQIESSNNNNNMQFNSLNTKIRTPMDQNSSVLNSNNQLINTTLNSKSNNIYSYLNELNEQDLNEFKSNHFTLGRIPHEPPPKELCFF